LDSITQTTKTESEFLRSVFERKNELTQRDAVASMAKLGQSIEDRQEELVAAIREATHFVRSDCREIIESCANYLQNWRPTEVGPFEQLTGNRSLNLKWVPWGVIAAILPQNAYFSAALTIIANGLATGNRVILRGPFSSERLTDELRRLCEESGLPNGVVEFVHCDARAFLDAWENAEASALLHFMGSSERGASLVERSWRSGKPVLIDGTGNSWTYIDSDQDPYVAAELVWKGCLRYNGQTCTSVNGAVVHPSIALAVRKRLLQLLNETTFGVDEHEDVGPLFTAEQADLSQNSISASGGNIVTLSQVQGALFPPTIVLDPRTDSQLLSKGVFCPAMWVLDGDWSYFKHLWTLNRYPLCAGVLSIDDEVLEEAITLPRASRVVLNGDTSIEDPSEPWGAYPPCGSNPVGAWSEKYVRAVQIDQPVA
jgi:acyl-CoA reductase-like NAD-dependent aldehyde dehydrogenase